MKEFAGTITSSPAPIPRHFSVMKMASVYDISQMTEARPSQLRSTDERGRTALAEMGIFDDLKRQGRRTYLMADIIDLALSGPQRSSA